MRNPDEKRKTVEDAVDFRLVWNVNDYWADVVAYEHCGASDDGTVIWADAALQLTDDFEQADPYLSGFVKWDGCSEFNLGHQHFCGPHLYAQHARLLRYIFFRAHELMGRGPEDKWPEEEPLSGVRIFR